MERRITKLLFIGFIISGIISSCYYDNEEELYPTVTECSTDSLTYDANIATIINSKCATPACHGGTQSPNLSDYNSVNTSKDRIKTRAVDQKTMPPLSSNALNDCEIKQLEAWINNGAPQN